MTPPNPLTELAERELRIIPGFSRFAISCDGIVHRMVKSHRQPNAPDIVKQWPRASDGRLSVFLTDDMGARRNKQVSNLVARAWIGPPPDGKPHSAHLDGKVTNNHYENIVWASPAENEAHKKLHGTCPLGEQTNSAKLTRQQVQEIKSLASQGLLHAKLAAEQFGVHFTTIYRITRGEQWQHIKT